MRIYHNGKAGEIKISNIHFDGIGYTFIIEEMKVGSIYAYNENATVKFSDKLGPILFIENGAKIPIKKCQELIDYIWSNADKLERLTPLYSYTTEYKINYLD